MTWKNLLIRTNKGETSSRQQDGWSGEQKKGEEHATKELGTSLVNLTKGWGCFICGGPQRARDCPNQDKLSALIADDRQGEKFPSYPPYASHIQSFFSLT